MSEKRINPVPSNGVNINYNRQPYIPTPSTVTPAPSSSPLAFTKEYTNVNVLRGDVESMTETIQPGCISVFVKFEYKVVLEIILKVIIVAVCYW